MPRPESPKEEGALVYPLFPLGSIVYLPNTEHTLNIFEPRYRKMYNDILLSGSRSFAVTMVGPDGSFAEYASIFYLDDLKEVSEQTKDQVKYVCQHKVTKRVRLKKVLNPSAWRDASTYLQVEVEEVEDVEDDASTEADIAELCNDMDLVVNLQNEFKEEPRFSPQLKGVFTADSMAAAGEEEGGEDKVWAMASLWQTFAGERMSDVQRKGANLIEQKLLAYLTKNGTVPVESLKGKQLSIPPELEKQVSAMTAAVKLDLAERAPTMTVPYQQLMQSESRGERVRILRSK